MYSKIPFARVIPSSNSNDVAGRQMKGSLNIYYVLLKLNEKQISSNGNKHTVRYFFLFPLMLLYSCVTIENLHKPSIYEIFYFSSLSLSVAASFLISLNYLLFSGFDAFINFHCIAFLPSCLAYLQE